MAITSISLSGLLMGVHIVFDIYHSLSVKKSGPWQNSDLSDDIILNEIQLSKKQLHFKSALNQQVLSFMYLVFVIRAE